MSSRSTFALVSALALAASMVPSLAQAGPPGPAFVFTETGGTTVVAEAGPEDSYRVRLSAPPASTSLAIMLVATDGRVLFIDEAGNRVATLVLHFTPTDFATDKTVRLAANDDAATQGTVMDTVRHVPDASDAVFGGVQGTLVVRTIDNDAGLGIGQTGGATTVLEPNPTSAGTDSFALSLGAAPTADVRVRLSPDPQLSVSLLSVTLRPSDWSAPRTLTVAAVQDDFAEGLQVRPIGFALTSADPAYHGRTATLAVTIIDNDVAGLVFLQGSEVLPPSAKLSGVGKEGGPGVPYKVALASRPASPVTVSLGSVEAGQLVATPASLTFTGTSWKTPQTVTLVAADDAVDEGRDEVLRESALRHVPTSSDATYGSALAREVRLDVQDNDQAGVRMAQDGATIPEPEPGAAPPKLAGKAVEGGNSVAYVVRLESQPTADVVVDVGSDQGPMATVSPARLSFGADTWDDPQVVTVQAIVDSYDNGPAVATATLTHALTTSDATYAALAARALRVDVTDDDVAKVLATTLEQRPSVSEAGDSFVYWLRLATPPRSDVTVRPFALDRAPLEASPVLLTFTPSTWDTWQTVVVGTSDDTEPELDFVAVLEHHVAGNDPAYTSWRRPQPWSVQVLDNDGALVLLETGGLTVVQEGGPGDTYSVRLAANPTAPVTVTLAVSEPSLFRINGASTTTLTFEPGSSVAMPCQDDPTVLDCRWNVPRTIEVTPLDDATAQGSRTGQVSHTTASAGDARFNGRPGQMVGVLVWDDDPGVLVVQSDGATAVAEGGSGDSYAIRLATPPTFSVAIAVTAEAGLVLDQSMLYFDAETWDVPQQVMVEAVDDSVAEGDHVAIIQHASSSGDAAYHEALVADVQVTIRDDDGSTAAEGL